MDELVLVLVALFLYAYFRSYGGKGLGIKLEFAPASTPQGKRDRIATWCVLAIAAAAITYVVIDQGNQSIFGVVIPMAGGALITLVTYLRGRKKK